MPDSSTSLSTKITATLQKTTLPLTNRIITVDFAVYPNHIFVLLVKAGLYASFEK